MAGRLLPPETLIIFPFSSRWASLCWGEGGNLTHNPVSWGTAAKGRLVSCSMGREIYTKYWLKREKIKQKREWAAETSKWEKEKKPRGKGRGKEHWWQSGPNRTESFMLVPTLAISSGSSSSWVQDKKTEVVSTFYLDDSPFWSQFIVNRLPADASLVWSFGVQRLGSPDLCICLFVLYNLRRCLYN